MASSDLNRRADIHPSLLERKVIHVDMDAFFAAVEARDRPELRGKPVVVGGDPGGRGVVATASYEARAFGIGSAMPAAQARRRCPHAVFVRPRMEVYAAEARRIRQVFLRYTDQIEPLSLDEAYLDVTRDPEGRPATVIAEAIRHEIREATGGLTASAGIAPNKLVAKIASDLRKPNGLFVVRPEAVRAFMGGLPARRIPGVGRVTAARLGRMGVERCEDAWPLGRADLQAALGRSLGATLYDRLRGIDPRPVMSEWVPKSIGHEDTFAADRDDLDGLTAHLAQLVRRVAARLATRGARGRTVVLKVRYADFTTITRSRTLDRYTDDADTIAGVVLDLLTGTEVGSRKVRLLGVTVSGLYDKTRTTQGGQRLLFELPL